MGAVVLPLMGIYLGLLIWASWYGWRWAKRRNYSTGKRALCAFGGFLIVYLPLMWDWIPTELAHRYYCKKEAGLWIYKTLDQWKAENPGVFETLVYNKDRPYGDKSYKYSGNYFNNETVYFMNSSFSYIRKRERISKILPVNRRILELVDVKTGFVLARFVDINYGGYKPALGFPAQEGITGVKFWMNALCCKNGLVLEDQFFDIVSTFEGAKK